MSKFDPTRDVLLNDREVAAALHISRPTVWAMSKDGRLPRPIRLGPRSVRWAASQISESVANCQRAAA